MTTAYHITDAPDVPARLVELARGLLSKGGALQSMQQGELIDGPTLTDALVRSIGHDGAVSRTVVRAAIAGVVASAQSALDRVAGGEAATNLSDDEVSALEVIVHVTGRPALRYVDGRVETPPSEVGDNEKLIVFVATARRLINARSAAVGRVTLGPPGAQATTLGTAWRIGDELVVSNRHVVRLLAANPDDPVDRWSLDSSKSPFVDFAFTHGTPQSQPVRLRSLEYCAAEPAIDLAVMRLDGTGPQLPPAIPLEWSADAVGRDVAVQGEVRFVGEEIYVVGHPHRPFGATAATEAVFGRVDGRKRCSPGFVMRVDRDTPTLEHDCSTLGGNSGSCVLSIARHAVVGLHFGGRASDGAETEGRSNVAVALSRLGDGPVTDLLKSGRPRSAG